MRKFFEPTGPDVPPWLKSILTSIRQALGDIWDRPIRLKDYATADLPSAAEFVQGLVYDKTAVTVKWSDGSTWNAFQASDPQLDAVAGATPAADQVMYWTSATAVAMTGLTAFGRDFIDSAAASDGRTVLGLGTAATRNTGTSGTTIPLLDGGGTFSATVTFNTAATGATNITGDRSLANWGQSGPNLRVSANTLTNTSVTTPVAVQAASSFGQPTFDSTNVITVTAGATLYVHNAPAAGTNTTITNAWAIYVATGGTRLNALTATGNCDFGDNVGDAHTFTGNVTITESSGNALILKDSADSGNAALLTIDIQGADGASVGSLSKNSASTGDISLTSVGGDLRLLAVNALQGTITVDGINLVSGNFYSINATQVLGARNTGWTADTGTAAKGASATYTAPAITNPPTQAEVQAIANALQAATRSIKAIKDGAIGHGFFGA